MNNNVWSLTTNEVPSSLHSYSFSLPCHTFSLSLSATPFSSVTFERSTQPFLFNDSSSLQLSHIIMQVKTSSTSSNSKQKRKIIFFVFSCSNLTLIWFFLSGFLLFFLNISDKDGSSEATFRSSY